MAEISKVRVGDTVYPLVPNITAEQLLALIKGSETVVVDLDETGTMLEVHLDNEVTNKLNKALVTPTMAPSVRQVVTVGTNNAQSNIPESSLVSGAVQFLTTAPTSANANGLKVVVLTAEPATKYDGYIYIIKEA